MHYLWMAGGAGRGPAEAALGRELAGCVAFCAAMTDSEPGRSRAAGVRCLGSSGTADADG